MSEPIDGGPVTGGISLRDYFAAKAMQSFVATINRATAEEAEDVGMSVVAFTSRAAYIMADAMLAQRIKP